MKTEDYLPRLTSEFGYPAAGARLIAAKLAAFSQPVMEAFQVFWETGQIPAFEIAGYTAARLMAEHNMKPIAAFLTLDWLAREPEAALASLRKGHDEVLSKSEKD